MGTVRTALVIAGVVLSGFLAAGQGMALVPSTPIPNPGSEVSFQVTGAPPGAHFRWDFTGDGRPDATTNQPVASRIFPAGYWEIAVEVVHSGKTLSRLAVAVMVDARLGAFRVARWNGDVLEVTVTLFAKQFIVAPGLVENVPPGWVVRVLDEGGGIAPRRGDRLEVLWSTYLDPGMSVQVVYALYPPSARSAVRLSGTASAYQDGRRIETPVAGGVVF